MTDLTNPIFQDADKARQHLESIRWPNGPVCPHCGARDHLVAKVAVTKKQTKTPKSGEHRPARDGLYYCNSCTEQFTVQVGTVLEKSHIPLNKWLAGFYLMCSSKKGVSAHQLHRTLAISYKSAWFMAHRIREAMRVGGLMSPMGGEGQTVEVDETIYGRADTHPKGRRPKSKGRHRTITNSAHKNVIVSLVQRDGSVRSFHVAGSTVSDVIPIVNANIRKETFIMTDSAMLYKKQLGSFASHDRVDHSIAEYVRYEPTKTIHTNTVEGYFSLFKRGMRGVYQHCDEKHLHRYLAEFDFRYSNRVKLGIDDTERTARAIKGAEGKRLTYRRSRSAEAN